MKTHSFAVTVLKHIELDLVDQPSLGKHKACILCAMQYPQQHNLCRPSVLTYLREPSVRKKYRMPAFAMHLKLVIECDCLAQFKFACILTSYWYRSQLYPI